MKDYPFVFNSDSYKSSHAIQYPGGTTEIYSYGESRGGSMPAVLFFGLQYILKRHFTGSRVKTEDIQAAEEFYDEHFGSKVFNRSIWDYIVKHHDGKLPLEIKAVPEGTLVPTHNVLYTIRNTDPNCWWLTNFAETLISQVWAPSTVASNGYFMKQDIKRFMEETCDSLDSLNFMVQDFGYRGVSSFESAGILGASHLVNFQGTDTIAGILFGREFYNTKSMLGFSVPASEHSTMTSWGRDNESDAYLNMLVNYPTGIVSIVSDSYDVYNAVENILCTELKSEILNRDGKLVFRPDSGDPVEVNKRLLNSVWERVGGTINSKGYKKLDAHVGFLQGDGINRDMVNNLLAMEKEQGFACDSIIFGSGGKNLQAFDRDTMKFAIKAAVAVVEGEQRMVSKDPITDSGKRSKAGYLKLVRDGDSFKTVSSLEAGYEEAKDELVTVFLNGEMTKEYTFEEVRQNAK